MFPDAIPARVRVASHAGRTRALQQAVERAQREGLSSEPAQAAEQVVTLIAALGVHDRRTRGHAERVRVFADLVGEQMRLSEEDTIRLRWASLLHDVGKLAVPSAILNKPGRPDADEWAILQSHPSRGREFAGPLLGFLGDWAHAIDHHHERWDGSGYPNGLVGDDIALAGRIIGVADAFEVITAARAYKKPLSVTAAREELVRCAGTHFDPQIVRHFLDISIGTLSRKVGFAGWFLSLPIVGAGWFRESGDEDEDSGALEDDDVRAVEETPSLQPRPPATVAATSSQPSPNGDQRDRADDPPTADSEPVADAHAGGLPPADAVATWATAITRPDGDAAEPAHAGEQAQSDAGDPFAFGAGVSGSTGDSAVPSIAEANVGGFGSGASRSDDAARTDDPPPSALDTPDPWAAAALTDAPWDADPLRADGDDVLGLPEVPGPAPEADEPRRGDGSEDVD